MKNKYQVKIDDSVMPESYTFDQLIDEGLLDEIDEKIKVRLNGEDVWQTARNYPFADIETNEQKRHTPLEYSQRVSYSHERKSNANQHETTSTQCNNQREYAQRTIHRIMPELPPIVDKWNWGAFCFSWLWGIFNGLYWPLIIIALNFIPYIGLICSLFICFVLGKRGNEIAWRIAKENGSTIDDFTDIQIKWNITGLLLLVMIVCALIFVSISFLFNI